MISPSKYKSETIKNIAYKHEISLISTFMQTCLFGLDTINVFEHIRRTQNGAGIAQLVEPYLAKVAVASSSLVSRSTFLRLRTKKWSVDQCFRPASRAQNTSRKNNINAQKCETWTSAIALLPALRILQEKTISTHKKVESNVACTQARPGVSTESSVTCAQARPGVSTARGPVLFVGTRDFTWDSCEQLVSGSASQETWLQEPEPAEVDPLPSIS